MGTNRSGARRTKRLKRRKKEEERLAAKYAAGDSGKPAAAGAKGKK
jgi:hypothetical protein